MFVPMIEEKSSRNSLLINADKLLSEIFVYFHHMRKLYEVYTLEKAHVSFNKSVN